MMNLYLENCSNNIKKIRKDFNLTQSELAKILNTTKQAISLYETAKTLPPIHVLIRLSEYFNVSIDSLIFDKKDIQKNSDLNLDFIYDAKQELNSILEIEKDIYSITKKLIELSPQIKNKVDNLNNIILNQKALSDKNNAFIEIPVIETEYTKSLNELDLLVNVPYYRLNVTKKYEAFKMNDSSMNQLYEQDELLLVEIAAEIRNNEIVIAATDDGYICRKVLHTDSFDSVLLPVTFDNIKYKPTYLGPLDGIIIGKVLGKVSDFT